MTRYRRKLGKPLALDTPAVRAAVNLVLAVEAGEQPNADTLRTLHDAFLQLFGGTPPKQLFGSPCGLALPRKRPPDHGFTPADVVSAFIELERRRLIREGVAAALTRAKEAAVDAFVEFDGQADTKKAINRYWGAGRGTAEVLDDDELRAILDPYQLRDK